MDESRREVQPGSSGGSLELLAFWQDHVRVFSLPRDGRVTIGRAEDNAICIAGPSVSRYHALLHVAERVVIEDLGGTNGTFVRSDRELTSGDTVGLRQLSRDSAELAVGEGATLGGVTVVLRRSLVDATSDLLAKPADGERAGSREPSMIALYDQAERVAQSVISVMILGETGVGKEVLARAIHARSPRHGNPFVGINCAALSGTLLESELFGYEKAAFTGATQARPGLFEAADTGTVFLDEIGELPLETQAKLLRIIEERTVQRIGARTPRSINVRFICATNRDLETELSQARFRSDLYYRLNGINFVIPPLRERPRDIAALALRFVAQACRQLERANIPTISADVMALLCAHSWPGNVRELKNAIERAVVLCDNDTIEPEHLPVTIADNSRRAPVAKVPDSVRSAPPAPDAALPIRSELRRVERARMLEALARCNGNQTQAAKLLGMSRRTFVARLAEYDIPRPRKPSAGQ